MPAKAVRGMPPPKKTASGIIVYGAQVPDRRASGQPPGIQCSSPLQLPPQTPTQMHPNQSTPPSMDPPPPGAQPTQNQSHQSPSSDQMNTNNASNNETASQSNDGSFNVIQALIFNEF